MAKYIIDVPDNIQWIQWMNVSEKDGSTCFDYKAPEDLTPYVRSESYIDGLKKGQNEVWELVNQIIFEMKDCERFECFGDENDSFIIGNFSYQEAKSKYETWKAEKNKICVGDEVIPLDTQYDIMIVTKLWTSEFCDEWVDTIAVDGKAYHFLKANVLKTGRHFDEVENLIKKMKEKTE